MFFRRELLGEPDRWLGIQQPERYPRLLSERFFFGEEDWDFSLRMGEEKRKMACVMSSIVYHKQGETHKAWNGCGKTKLYYLQRFIDIRQHWGGRSLRYRLWKLAYAPYIAYIFYRRGGCGVIAAIKQVREVIKSSASMEAVSKEIFWSYLH